MPGCSSWGVALERARIEGVGARRVATHLADFLLQMSCLQPGLVVVLSVTRLLPPASQAAAHAVCPLEARSLSLPARQGMHSGSQTSIPPIIILLSSDGQGNSSLEPTQKRRNSARPTASPNPELLLAACPVDRAEEAGARAGIGLGGGGSGWCF